MNEKAVKDILFAYGENNDITAHPWWAIVRKGGFGRLELLCGPFFSRESAERKRTNRIYHYGEKSFVYCFSGHDSPDYVELRRAVSEEAHPR